MIGVGVIGLGYWGPNLLRNVADLPGACLVCASDLRADRRDAAAARYPGIRTTRDAAELIQDPAVDAVAIATPVSTHFELAMAALRAGKHVLVEKPLAASSEQGRRLIEEATRRKLVLMVDHTFVYTGAVRKIASLVSSGELGELYYYDSVRVNLGLFQHDVNVIWDLAVHDLSIMDHVLPLKPRAVSATGMSHVAGGHENIAYLTLFFDTNFIAHIHVNWLAPVKVRRTLLGGSQRMIVYDDLEPSEKIKVYDRGITLNSNPENVYEMLVGYRSGDMWAPRLEAAEALKTEITHFLDCIERGVKPLTDGVSGLRVLELVEAASESMASRGRLVELGARSATASS
ncbi:MAG TPA: Gfo/Idh/MocA family oxidoreductase [Vicinamibacterales bacterium]|nr:Gfo/Idh/MocA family oxidoreductase [Vicinamibacterales bacterium]